MKSTELVPNLRFPSFNGAWSQKLLKELAEIKTGSKDTQNREPNGLYPFYVRSDTIERINSFAYDGEAVLTSGDGVGVGKNIHYVNGKFDYHQRVYAIYKFDRDLNGLFFYHFFKEKFLGRVMRLSAKNSVDSVRMSMISDMTVPIPTLPEQQKIAGFFNALDAGINQLAEKINLLEQYKTGCMRQIFTQAIRFKDDQGMNFPKWNEMPLGELVYIKKGQQLNRDDMIENAPFPVINGGIAASGYSDTYNTKGGVITVSEGGNSCGYVDWQSSDFWLGGHCYALPLKSEITVAEYLLQYLRNSQTDIMALRVGSGLPNIQKRDLEKFPVALPQLGEQRKIADFLSAIDFKISLASSELKLVKLFKKGLLQQMLV